jgi:hypothetical protein
MAQNESSHVYPESEVDHNNSSDPTLGFALLEKNPLAKPEVNLTNRTYQETEAREISIHRFMNM